MRISVMGIQMHLSWVNRSGGRANNPTSSVHDYAYSE